MTWREITLCGLRLRLEEEMAEASPIVMRWRARRLKKSPYRPKAANFGRTKKATRMDVEYLDGSIIAGRDYEYATRLAERFRRRDEEIALLKRENSALKTTMEELKRQSIEQQVRHKTEIRRRDFKIQQLTRERLNLERRIEMIEQDMSEDLLLVEMARDTIKEELSTSEHSDSKKVASYPPGAMLDERGLFSSEDHDGEWLHPKTGRQQESPEGSEHLRLQQSKLKKATKTIRILRNQMKLATDTKHKLIEDYEREIEILREERDQWEIECLDNLSKKWADANKGEHSSVKQMDSESHDEKTDDDGKPHRYVSDAVEESKQEFRSTSESTLIQNELDPLASEKESLTDAITTIRSNRLGEKSNEDQGGIDEQSCAPQEPEIEDHGLEQLINEIAEVTREMRKGLDPRP